MPLKSTNIWDDVRGENAEEDSSVHWRHSAVRRGSSPTAEDQHKSGLGTTGSPHANRHGISMKSLMKNRKST